jgi:acetyl esterase/lipase
MCDEFPEIFYWVAHLLKTFLLLSSVLVLALAGAFSFAPLQTFNVLVPKDPGVERVAQDVAYGADQRQRFDVYRPQQAGSHPLLVFVYGGGWQFGSKEHYEFAARAYAAQGFVVAVPDYRIVPNVVYPAFVEDIASAIAAAQREGKRFNADVSRTYLVGHSAGAYNVTQAVMKPGFLEAAGVKPETIKAVATLAGPFDFVPLDVKYTIDAFSHLSGAALDETQPFNHARAGLPAFLILHGEADETVFLRSPHKLETSLREAGATVEMKVYAGISHSRIMLTLSRFFRDSAPVLEDSVAFFRKHP